MHEDRSSDVDGIWGQAAVMDGVDLLSERLLLDRSGGNIVGNGGNICGLPEPCHDLLADGLTAGIDMLKMDGCRVRWLFHPQMRDRPRQQAQHAPHSLKIAERRRLAGQGLKNVRMQWITRPERLHRRGASHFTSQGFSVGRPETPVGIDDRTESSASSMDSNRPPAQDLDRLVLLGGVQQRRLARGNALRFRHVDRR